MLEVGRITRAHGLKGEVIVELVTDREERVAPGSELWGGGRRLRVARATAHHGRWIVAFDGVADRTAAEGWRGTTLSAEALDDPDALWVHELIGSVVEEVGGVERGRVTSMIANPASDLLELESGALVPLRFVVAHRAGRVTVDVPDGLFEADGG